MKMKILFVEPSIYNFSGYYRAFNICQAYSNNKITVDMVVSSDKKFYLGIKRITVNPFFNIYILPRIYINLHIQGRVLRGLIAVIFGIIGKYDIVHVAMPQVPEGTIPAFILKLFGNIVVIDWDEMYENGVYRNSRLTHLYIIFFENICPKVFKYYTTGTDRLGEIVLKRGGVSYCRLINGVNLSELTVSSKNKAIRLLHLDVKTRYLLSFGSTFTGFRVYLLFKTFNEINKLDPAIKFLVTFNPVTTLRDNGFADKFPDSLLRNVIDIGKPRLSDLGLYMSATEATVLIMEDTDLARSVYPTRASYYLLGESVMILNDNQSDLNKILRPYRCSIMAKDIRVLARKAVDALNHPVKYRQLKQNVKLAKSDLSMDNIIKPVINYFKELVLFEYQK